jgi:virginiamycin A acetyltransferase
MIIFHFFINKIRRFLFYKKYKKRNLHNRTYPGNIFPIDSVQVGLYSYGTINVLNYNQLNKKDKLIIGNFVSIANEVKFLMNENHQTNTLTTFPLKSTFLKKHHEDDTISNGSIVIEDEVWIGYRATILSGVRIGKGAIIATGAVVTKDIPPYTLAGGIPARIIKSRFSDKTIKRLKNIHLSNLPENIIRKYINLFYTEIDNENILNEIELIFKKHETDKKLL